MMTQEQQVPPGVDPAQPSAARVYDYLLGGESNFAADRAAGDLMKSMAPELVDAAFANRGFHQRAAKWIAEQGIRQFIDLGSGLPTVGNTHQVVRKVRPDARVVYVDVDPMVLQYGLYLLEGDEAAAVVLADLRDPDAVLESEAVARLIDFREPVAVLMTAVLHFVSDDDDPAGLVARYAAPLAAGSFVALSHMTADQKPPAAVAAIQEAGRRSAGGGYLRSRDDLRRIVGPLEVVEPYQGAPPDVTWVGLWNCEDPDAADSEGSRWLYCAVARKTG
ncbi:MAG TPA: SAM-dependent methyltransferase [Streptosporangiaceae bacterium]|nr:SAM-dependent methyltransferase [Streptosporangiaceae bacterium]